jgi:hypothetical protein
MTTSKDSATGEADWYSAEIATSMSASAKNGVGQRRFGSFGDVGDSWWKVLSGRSAGVFAFYSTCLLPSSFVTSGTGA